VLHEELHKGLKDHYGEDGEEKDVDEARTNQALLRL
jgi:hypothetical protein